MGLNVENKKKTFPLGSKGGKTLAMTKLHESPTKCRRLGGVDCAMPLISYFITVSGRVQGELDSCLA